jgi:EVE domain/MrcB-like, N-terminal domain
VTEPQERLGTREGRKFLRDSAITIRGRVEQILSGAFHLDDSIDLRADPGLGAEYATSTIAYKLYEKGAVPDDKQIEANLSTLLSAYDKYLAMTENNSNIWMFQASPKYYDIRTAIRTLKEQTWLVSSYKNRIPAGQKAYLWEAGDEAGIVATANVITDPAEIPMREQERQFVRNEAKVDRQQTRVVLRIDHVLDQPLLRKELLKDPVLSDLQVIKFPRTTNFEVTREQAARIEQMLNGVTPEPTIANNMDLPKNLILYGPPGTGKTYQTVNKALEILDRHYFDQHKDDRRRLKERFDHNMRSRHIEFVTFHQSFAYEDFVEGIRAETTTDGARLLLSEQPSTHRLDKYWRSANSRHGLRTSTLKTLAPTTKAV